MSPAPKSALGGIALTLGATALFASLDTATKLVLTTVPLMMALWFRYFVQAVTTTVILVPRRGWRIGYTGRPGLHLLRGLLLVGLDVIGDRLTEINVTSPTCFREIMDQTGFDVAAMFTDALEQAVAAGGSA